LTRHELKELQQDQFATKVGGAFEFASTHRSLVIRWVVIVLAVVGLTWGGVWYYNQKRTERQADLRDAFETESALVGPVANPYTKNFPTEEAKSEATLKAFSQVAAKHSGTKEGYLALYYVAILRNQKGDTAGAIPILREVADSGYSVASLAKVSLSNLLAGQGKYAEAEQILRSLVDKPTDLVSKEHAQVLLARVIGKHDPKAAKALIATIEGGRLDPDRPGIIRGIQHVEGDIDE
jgi:hypothetical protein